MKYALAVAAVMVAMVSSSVFAGEGRVSQAQLASLGLSGLEVMSDAQGREIRGQGFAFAASVSGSALPGTFNFSPAIALGFNHADASSAAASEASLDVLVGTPLPVFSLQIKAAVGSAGSAVANSN